jgi:hypothetical protein
MEQIAYKNKIPWLRQPEDIINNQLRAKNYVPYAGMSQIRFKGLSF